MRAFVLLIDERDAALPFDLLITMGGVLVEGSIRGSGFAQANLEEKNNWLIITREAELLSFYTQKEHAFFANLINPFPFRLNWSSGSGEELLESFLKRFPQDVLAWGDNTDGIIAPMQDFCKSTVSKWMFQSEFKK